ncbi:MAG: carbazole 1,9a-dioxygenase terminal dioxygenase component, partial [Cryomorphaceae bacterium]
MSDVTKDLLEGTQDYVEQAKAKAAKVKKPWQTWLDAELGFRNHWYPASLSRHLGEGDSKAIELLGEEILVTRQNGVTRAMEDRCPHRGTRFSSR